VQRIAFGGSEDVTLLDSQTGELWRLDQGGRDRSGARWASWVAAPQPRPGNVER
jgi:hypothetical protein